MIMTTSTSSVRKAKVLYYCNISVCTLHVFQMFENFCWNLKSSHRRSSFLKKSNKFIWFLVINTTFNNISAISWHNSRQNRLQPDGFVKNLSQIHTFWYIFIIYLPLCTSVYQRWKEDHGIKARIMVCLMNVEPCCLRLCIISLKGNHS